MSLDKAIKFGKERRKRYWGAKEYDVSCRNGGGCPWCYGDRKGHKEKIQQIKEDELLDELLDEFYDDGDEDDLLMDFDDEL
jgi:hypothetical protein